MKCLLLILLSCLSPLLWAAGVGAPLRDPTRPPDFELEGGALAGEQGLRLDAVKRTRHGKAVAVINGAVLHVGDEIQGLRLLSIAESGVVLKGPEGRQELRLTPAVERFRPGKKAIGDR